MRKSIAVLATFLFVSVLIFWIGGKLTLDQATPGSEPQSLGQNGASEVSAHRKRSSHSDQSNVSGTPMPSKSGATSFEHAAKRVESGSARSRDEMALFPYPELTPEIEADLSKGLSSTAGFRPPDYADFDRLFLERGARYFKSYTGFVYKSGIYFGAMSDPRTSKEYRFLVELDVVDPEKSKFRAKWLRALPERVAPQQMDLSGFRSEFEQNERYFGVLSLPSAVLANVYANYESCKELAVLSHYDWSEKGRGIEAFSARGYCRQGLTNLKYVAKFAFRAYL